MAMVSVSAVVSVVVVFVVVVVALDGVAGDMTIVERFLRKIQTVVTIYLPAVGVVVFVAYTICCVYYPFVHDHCCFFSLGMMM